MNKFRECSSCASTPGSPTLCKGCLHNRRLIERIQRTNNQLADKFWMELPNPNTGYPVRDDYDWVTISGMTDRNWWDKELKARCLDIKFLVLLLKSRDTYDAKAHEACY